jgi:hypothetical protein
MNDVTVESIRQAIADIPDPETGRGLGAMGQILDIALGELRSD